MSSSASASWGMAFGETKLVASISRNPASATSSMKRSFASVEIGADSFWSPSRGPTSYTRTSRSAIGVMVGGHLAEDLPALDLLSFGAGEVHRSEERRG